MRRPLAAVALFALNPNTLYLQSIPMNEVAVVRVRWPPCCTSPCGFGETQGWGSVAGAGIAACAGTLTRYDAWLLVPFVAVYFLAAARQRRLAVALVFSAIALRGSAVLAVSQLVVERGPAGFLLGAVVGARDSGERGLSGEERLGAGDQVLPHGGATLRRSLPAGDRDCRGGGGAVAARVLAAVSAAAPGRAVRVEHARRHGADLHAGAEAVLLLQHPLRDGGAAAAGAGGRRAGMDRAAARAAGSCAAAGDGGGGAVGGASHGIVLDHVGGIAGEFGIAPGVDRGRRRIFCGRCTGRAQAF